MPWASLDNDHYVSAKRRSRRVRAVLAAFVAILSAAGRAHAALPPAKAEGPLTILALPGTVERGEVDPAFDWVTPFEKETGCKVVVKTAPNSEEMFTLLARGGVDLVVAPSDVSQRLIAAKRVQPVNLELVPSYRAIDNRLKGAPWYTVGGKAYGVPLQWGVNLLLYSTTVFHEAPTTWSVILEPRGLPDGKPNRGRVQAYDGPLYIADAALFLQHKRPELGIRDPYELNEREYAAALDLLRAQKPLVHRYWHDPTVQMSDFRNEGVAASSSFSYQANTLAADHQPVAAAIPVEGVTGWADTMMLSADAKEVGCAYRWMEWSLNPGVQVALGEWFGSSPVVPKACREKSPGGEDVCKMNFFDRLPEVRFWRAPSAKCRSHAACVPYARWISDYQALTGVK